MNCLSLYSKAAKAANRAKDAPALTIIIVAIGGQSFANGVPVLNLPIAWLTAPVIKGSVLNA